MNRIGRASGTRSCAGGPPPRAPRRRAPAPRAAALVLTPGIALGVPGAAAEQGAPAGQAAPPSTHVIVVGGLGGSPEYSAAFHEQAATMLDAARDRWGIPAANLVWLAEDPARAPERIRGRSTRDEVRRELEALAGRAGPADAVLLLLIGHGTGAGGESKLNLPGPDLTAADLADWLRVLGGRTVAVVNTASASGGFVPALSGERRIVVTATRSAREGERTHFGGFFVESFAEGGADADRDGRVSLLEAFTYARDEVARLYERDNQLLTEHAQLDDNGDGVGSDEPSLTAADGGLAGRFFLASAPEAAADAADDPELARLLEEKRRLEERIGELRGRREEMPAEEYDAALEALLLQLLEVNRAIEARTDGPR